MAICSASRTTSNPRPRNAAPRVRSLAYFQPVIQELQDHPVPDGYLDYLRLKIKFRGLMDKAGPAKVHKSTSSDHR
jgi:hypothetical protein